MSSRNPFTIVEEDRLLQLIFMSKTANFLRGAEVWQNYIDTNRFPGRTWQSLKERFIKKIIPSILHDGYRTPLWVRRWILIIWHRTAKDSKPNNVTRDWDELFKLAGDLVSDESNITVSNKCKQVYEEMKQEEKHRFAILHIKDEKKIDVEFVGTRHEDYNQFLTDLQIGGESECRYGLYDLEYTSDGAGTSTNTRKLFLILWCPDTAPDDTKDMYKRSLNDLQECLGVEECIEATDLSAVCREAVEAKLLKNTTDSR